MASGKRRYIVTYWPRLAACPSLVVEGIVVKVSGYRRWSNKEVKIEVVRSLNARAKYLR